jgi:hypothetical protein
MAKVGGTESDCIAERVEKLGQAQCAAMVAAVAESPESQQPVRDLKQSIRNEGFACQGDSLERALLAATVPEFAGRIDALPVPPAVREMIRKQQQLLSQPAGSQGPSLAIDAPESDPFIAACKICTLRRFPAGPLDWVVSGFPRSWLLKIPRGEIVRVLRFLLGEFGGFKPAFYVHVAHPPRNRSLVIQKEVRKAYFRMAQALELQPEIKGIMCSTWLHDPEALKMYPHLMPLNEPYLHLGGRLLTNLGPAPESSGFLKFSAERRAQYERGELHLKSVVAMWPRRAALDWARQTGEPT